MLNLELLEDRLVLSGPTADQQYVLSLVNFLRTNPAQAGNYLTSNISPVVQGTLNSYGLSVSQLKSELDSATPQPALAWSDSLASAATAQSQYEANTGQQTHTGANGASLLSRINSAGYNNTASEGENTYAWAQSIDEAMQAFLLEWGVPDHGHYNNLLQPGTSANSSFRDLGVGLVNTNQNGVGPLILTQDFGSQQNEGPQIVGVAYNDQLGTGLYSQGEGFSGLTVDAKNVQTGQDVSTTTWGSGGFQLPVASNGTYKVTVSENGNVISSQNVQVGMTNQLANFNISAAQVQAASQPTPPPPPPAAPPVPTFGGFQSGNVQQVTQANSSTNQPSWPSGWSFWTAAVS
jgi:uncharacterized protein YkwD